MTSTTATSPMAMKRETPMLSSRGMVWTAILAVSFIALFFNFIWRMYNIATDRWGGDWSHALVIPFISLYYIYLKRETISSTPRRVYWPGLALFFFGLFSYAWWISPGRNDMLQGYSMIVALFGLVLFLVGPRMMLTLWFPILYLVFAVKVAPRYWEQIAAYMQLIASHASKYVLIMIGIDAEVRGTTIDLYKNFKKLPPLNVAEACAGLRMLMAFMALGVAMAFLFDRAWWQRLIMVLLTVPIAIAVNVGRVTTLGVLHMYQSEAAKGDFHKFVGIIMLGPALLVFLLVGWILDRIIVADETAPLHVTPPPIEHDESDINWGAIVEGIAGGAALTALLGLAYVMFFASIKSGVFGEWLTPRVAQVSLAVAVLLFVGAAILLRRRSMTGPSSRTRNMPQAIAVGVLIAAVLGLWGTIKANGMIPIKKPIDLREQIYRVPDQLGNWKKLSEDPPLNAEILEELGTTQYISRLYTDTSAPSDKPSIVKLHVAYYTGTPDTVPHVPERCLTAAGMANLGKTTLPVALRGAQYENGAEGWTAAHREVAVTGLPATTRTHIPTTDFDITVFSFGDPNNADNQSTVTYFFAANGKFLANPDAVRFQGFDPRDEYSYYCKIEVNLPGVRDPQVAAERSANFLSSAVPEIMACLPDWVEVQQGKYPPKPGTAPAPAAATPKP